MHPARIAGLVAFLLGGALLACAFWASWLPLPRIFTIAGPPCVLMGAAMLIHPGPEPHDGEFDMEDWYDEASLGAKIAYSAAGLVGIGLGIWLYIQPLLEHALD